MIQTVEKEWWVASKVRITTTEESRATWDHSIIREKECQTWRETEGSHQKIVLSSSCQQTDVFGDQENSAVFFWICRDMVEMRENKKVSDGHAG